MPRSLPISLVLAALVGLHAPAAARAAFYVYDEATRGDLPISPLVGTVVAPNPLAFGDAVAVTGTLSGTISSPNFDGQDSFRFELTSAGRVAVAPLSVGTATGLVAFLYTFVDGQLSDGFSVGRVDNPSSGSPDLFGFLGPGAYALTLVPAGNTGTISYGVTVSGVPEPSSLALCGVAGLVGLGVARCRRRTG